MYDSSSKDDWGRGERDTVIADWQRVLDLSAKYSSSYLRDADGNRLFLAFGATPFPTMAEVGGCEDGSCVFYAQDGRTDSGIDDAPGLGGAFTWVEPGQVELSSSCDSTRYPDTPTPCIQAAY